MTENQNVVFVSRPGVNGEPKEENFRFEQCPYPVDIQKDEVLIKTLYLSTDPALRCRMNESTGVDYVGPWQIGETIEGFGGVGSVMKSLNPEFVEGDLVCSQYGWPWKEYFVKKPDKSFQKVDKSLVGGKISYCLSILSLTGLTSYLGLTEKGHIQPSHTLVISGAAGACGSLAGQFGRLKGCDKVIGICGSDEKCQYLTDELGFNGAINYKTQNIKDELSKHCPKGIDVYFDNVGGTISDQVIKQMNKDSHVILCGQISVYNKDVPYPPPIPEETQQCLQQNNITRERFLVLNYPEKFDESLKQIAEWLLSGKIKVKETVAEGLVNAGPAFVSMMRGGNIGKQLIHVASP
ncbi:prostaglandin reductase 2-like isoform X1 [Mytilus galloprovincialis]|uniref:prostaglandin reductase 2-like isoform X1 n=2 Tax=Mytilus galloprovincialis TaxID=29158 RepID=UPI003F7CAC76